MSSTIMELAMDRIERADTDLGREGTRGVIVGGGGCRPSSVPLVGEGADLSDVRDDWYRCAREGPAVDGGVGEDSGRSALK
jgi:hypothetical protein